MYTCVHVQQCQYDTGGTGKNGAENPKHDRSTLNTVLTLESTIAGYLCFRTPIHADNQRYIGLS